MGNYTNAQNNNYQYQYEVITMDSTYDHNADLTMETYMKHLKQEKDKKMDQVIGKSKEVLTSFSPLSPLSNLLVDMLFEWGNNYLLSKKMGQADLALLNFGGIRAALPQGNITVGDIYQISPFDNTIAIVFVKGSELKKMFDSFTEKRNAALANVQTIYRTGRLLSYTLGGAPLDLDKIYILVTINFIALGGDDFLSQVNFESVNYLDITLRDLFIEEFKKKTADGIEIERVMDDRVIIRSTP
ncbi:MAG: 5'-nucleotidase C-terminal domain-containing protein [Lentimicrobiaceae bacterium]|nr:5'-nucleotidase C-terminal domain-containing protein [Lentimicrobiaceae bacterium]